MARYSRTEPPNEPLLTIDQMKRAIPRIRKRVEEIRAFDLESISERWSPEVKALEAAIDETLAAAFGHGTAKYRRYRGAAQLDQGPIEVGSSPRIEAVRRYLHEGKQNAVKLLETAIRGLEEDISDRESVEVSVQPEARLDLSRVFIVHGHDGEVREAVARFVSEKLGFEPIVLHERPNKGRTIIEKFHEEAAGVGFAVVLMTADDLGRASTEPDLKPRARQNVVFELGFFIGRLGPERVAAIVKGDLDRPSDFDGVVYISFDQENWREKLGRELQAAGYAVDWNRVMR